MPYDSYIGRKRNYTNKKKTRVKKTPERKHLNWDANQKRIFDFVANSDKNGVVLASPGSGKSTTIIESLYHTRPDESVLCCAFNKSIAENLDGKVPKHVHAKTFHKIGFQTVLKNWGAVYGLNGKCVDSRDEGIMALAGNLVGESEKTLRLREQLVYSCKLAKTTLSNEPAEIEQLCTEHGTIAKGISPENFASLVYKMMQKTLEEPLVSNGKSVISFDDMIWLPIVHGWQPQQYDKIFVDEAQDLSAARMELVINSIGYGGRVLALGDRNQAIYGFAGSTANVVDRLAEQMKADFLPLSITYRCPKRVVELAKKINPDIEARPDAPMGEVQNSFYSNIYDEVKPGSAILSRSNFPLIVTAMALLKRGVKANIQGKDIGNRFLWRIRMWEPDSVSHLINIVRVWREEMGEKIMLKNGSPDRIFDEADSILAFCENASTVQEVQERIDQFFSDDMNVPIKLSSTHKAKGLEWDTVYLLNNTFKPERSPEDKNIYYVAITRTKNKLVFVNKD